MSDYNFEPITMLEVAALTSEFNDNFFRMLDKDSNLKTRFDNAANEQESAAISASLKGIKIALEEDGGAMTLPANNATTKEMHILGRKLASLLGNEEEFNRAMDELMETTTVTQLNAANAYASIVERLNLSDQFQSTAPALMVAKKEALISVLDDAAEESNMLPIPPQPGLRAFLGKLSL